ncbi:MAG TPA: prolyl oligopeptidase family serine peptidase, partial [Gemmataceae bacterium]|nr:prolyl oligopeptidase family serine peptidase [Gemmataceae bacterium]
MFALSRLALLLPLVALAALSAQADGPKDNLPDNVRPVPPVGIELPAADAETIKAGLAELQSEIKAIGRHDLLPDVAIYEQAVRYAADYREVFDAKGIPAVKKVLKDGLERAKALKAGQHPWTTQTGYVVRGYRSKIDGSPQPYGLHVPAGYKAKGESKHRLDFWWHGRGETLSEVNFIANQQNAGGIIPAPGAFILAPYGRYCNANKFAGEIDTLECLDHVKKHYRIDESRLVARGFSMGGAACWQFAVHYPTLWCANAPGAGFSETPEFLKVFQNEKVEPAWYEKKLWHMYNATDSAINIFNLPTVAYSGEIDSQKQVADVMAREMKKVGLELDHVIGPKTGHSYEKGAKAIVNQKIDAIVSRGKSPLPAEIKFATYTLRYNRCGWAEVTGLEKHWEKAEVSGTFDGTKYTIATKGVTGLVVHTPAELTVQIAIDGTSVSSVSRGGPGRLRLLKGADGKWSVPNPPPAGLAKKPGLQGPIDDAFMDRFIFVRPTGTAVNDKLAAWTQKEMAHAIDHWRKQFRGDAIVKDDKDITADDIKTSNLVLWGDLKSNLVMEKVADKLPLKEFGDTTTTALIYPNPLNPKKYVVLNSGFT